MLVAVEANRVEAVLKSLRGDIHVISGIDIYRFAKGKVAERWGNADLMSMIQQLGYAVAPKAADGPKP